MERDRAIEAELLERASPTFAAEVIARLDRYEARHGNTGWDRPPAELVAEAMEEAADIVGWSVGAAHHELKVTRRFRLRVVARLAAVIHRELRELRDQLVD